MDRHRDRLAVVGVHEHPVGQVLDPLAAPRTVELPVERLAGRPGGKRSSATSRDEYCSISSRGEPSATIFALSITTSRSHSCSASSM